MFEQPVKRDDYFVLHVTMPSGFEFKIPARGYNLKSWLTFEERLESTVIVEQTNAAVYEHLIIGDPNDPLGELQNGSTNKRKAQRKNPPKASSSAKKGEGSKAVRNPGKRTTQASKEKPSVVRKPKVRNVRQPKKDVQGTDNPGTKTPTRSRKPKGSSQ